VRLLVELEYDRAVLHRDTPEELHWFFEQVLASEVLVVESAELGHTLGKLRVLDVVENVQAQ